MPFDRGEGLVSSYVTRAATHRPRHIGAFCLALVVACDGSKVTGDPEFQVQFEVLNYLIAPVHIAVDGAPYMSMFGGTMSTVIVSSRAERVSWISAKPTDENNVPIPDDIVEQVVSVAGINKKLEITNVIGTHTYFSARIYNETPSAVSIGVYDGTKVVCASKLPGSTASTRKFTQVGYYRLLPETELRAYSDPSNCTGSYVVWPNTSLRNFQERTGALVLSLATTPGA